MRPTQPLASRHSTDSRWWHNPNLISLGALAALVALLVTLASFGAKPQAAEDPYASCHAPGRANCTTAAQRAIAIGMTVSDMERSLAFYMDVLEFEMVSDVELVGDKHDRIDGLFGVRKRICTLRLGDELLELTEYLTPRGRAIPVDSRSNDLWFQHIAIIVSDMDAAYANLRKHRVKHASSGPQTLPHWNPNAGGIKAFYFRDPDDHVLEILQFPEGKGNPKWQQSDGRLFLGIDHTAIVVDDTDRSVAFYRDVLGMEVVGESENHGVEQEHLNHVFGARLRITTLRCPGDATDGPGGGGPAVELLEYLTPRDGRPFPLDTRASDLWHWQITMQVIDAAATARVLREARTTLISLGVIETNDDESLMIAGATVRDPDGHAVRLTQHRTATRAMIAPQP